MDTPVYQVGSTPVSFSVSDGGSASWSAVIPGPPSSGGFGPVLSLQWCSAQAFLGLVGGAGLALNGLPTISRSPQTTVQDGQQRGVSLDAGDRFTFGGGRLVNVSGVYGMNGTEYATEVQSFTRIWSWSDASSGVTGPAYFTAVNAAGISMFFGDTPDSRFTPAGRTDVAHAWALSRQSDRFSNFFTATYIPLPAFGTSLLGYVNYTGNSAAGTSPPNSIVMTYEPRPDVAPTFLAGYEAQTVPWRLVSATTYAGTQQAYSLLLDYAQSCSTSMSLATSVQLCGNDTAAWCYPPTTFAWTEACGGAPAPPLTMPPFAVNGTGVVAQQMDLSRVKQVDWNGDRLMGM
jgi:hypothetical protein